MALDVVGPEDAIVFTGDNPIGTSTISTLKAGNGAQVSFGGSYVLNGGKSFTFQSGADFHVASYLDIGNATGGSLIVKNPGSTLTTNTAFTTYLDWGRNGGHAYVQLHDSATADIQADYINIAADADAGSLGDVEVGTGADLTINGLYLATGSGSGYLYVRGNGSTLTQNGASTLTVGSTTGVIAFVGIFDHAVFTSGTGAITVNPSGQMSVFDATFNANGSLTVGSTGVLAGASHGVILESQGQIHSRDVFIGTNTADGAVLINGFVPGIGLRATWNVTGSMRIGSGGFGSGLATVEQAGRLDISNNLTVAGSMDATGTLTVQTNGQVTVGNDLTIGNYGTVNLLGSEINTHSFIVEPGGTFTHTDGTLTINGGTFDPGTGAGNYVITGADSADRPKVVLANGADSVPLGLLIVGQDNYGELTVEDGATLTSTDLVSSYAPTAPASSKITVQGNGSRLIITAPPTPYVSDPLQIGAIGPGELSISAGGQVQVQHEGASLACCYASTRGGSGEIIVEGQDSRLEAEYFHFKAYGGNSRVTIRDHGLVQATDAAALSEIWPTSTHSIDVEVTDGGQVHIAGDLWIAGAGQGSAYVDVDGGTAGAATFAVNGTMYVGGNNQYAVDGTAKLTVANGGLVNAGSVKVWQPGTIELNNGGIDAGGLELAGGTLRGSGDVSLLSGQLTNAGIVAPGLSAGILNINGDYVQDTAGTLAIELGGPAPYQYDRLQVQGSATLGGTLDVSLIVPAGGSDVFMPSAGTFEILTAAGGLGGTEFAAEVLPPLSGGLFFDVLYNPNDVTLAVLGVLGDYNHNGVVDAADYVVWRKTLGQSGPGLAADGTGPLGTPDGLVDQLDYQLWRSHFGQTAGSGALADATNASDAIPEPPALLLAVFGLLVGSMISGKMRQKCLREKRILTALLSFAIFLALSVTASFATAIADVAADFSPTNNPNGAWSYGWSTSLTSALTLYPNDVHASNGIDAWQDNGHISFGAPNVAHNSTGGVVDTDPAVVTWQPNQFSLHPGAGGEFSHAVWTSTVAGDLNLAGAFTGIDHTGTTSDVHIRLNAIPVFDGFVNGYGNTSSFSTTLTVGIGDSIDFAVGYGANYTFWDDSTALSATIVPGVPGDYNANGTVDAADYVVWRKNLGTSNDLPNDRIGGVVGPTHFEQWRAHFGQTAGTGASLAATRASDAIPEPATIALLLLGSGWIERRRRVSRRTGSRTFYFQSFNFPGGVP